MSGTRFDQLSARAQVLRLRATAFDALAEYPLDVARLRVLSHGFNTIFRVDTRDGRRFALRLNVNSYKTPAGLHAEMSWLAALAADTDLSIPTPLRTTDGRLHVEVWCPPLGRALPAAVFHWLPGPDVQGREQPVHLRALGEAMAALHTHAQGWSLPAGAELPLSDDVWMHGNEYLGRDHELLTPAVRALLTEAIQHVQPRYAAMFASSRPHVIHADLHLGNLKWYRGRLSVFDFDDCVIGVPGHDLAVSTYYLRPRTELVDALYEGYAAVRPLPVVPADQFEAMLAGRNILLLNELIGTETADFRDLLPTYMANAMLKLRHYLDTGVYRHDVEGVVPLW